MKALKKIGTIFGIIFGIIFGFCGSVIINGTCFKQYHGSEASSLTWMEKLDDEKLLNSVIIPGSHDACTYNMLWLGECQNLTINQQLASGVRYFDIRVRNKDNKYVIYHGPLNGVQFEPIMDSIVSFIQNAPTETLILDFQHFDNGAQNYVFEQVTNKLLPYAVINNTSKSDQQFVSELKMKDVRGKCLILFGYGEYANENYIFRRNNDDCSNTGCSLDSFYWTERNVSNSKTYISEHIPFYINCIKEKHSKESYKGLSVLQCQLTDGKMIFGPYSREKIHTKRMSEYIKNLRNSEDLKELNIIMRDFMNEVKAEEIYSLNFSL